MRNLLLLFSFITLAISGAQAQHREPLQHIATQAADSIPSLGAILIYQNQGLILEEYFHGANAETSFNVKSVTKSVVSLLTGIAHDHGLVPSLSTPVLSLLPEYHTSSLSHLTALSLEDLLNMQVGLVWDDNAPPSNDTTEYLQLYLSSPVECAPGDCFRYCTPASHLLGVSVAACVHTSLHAYADSVLFAPLGMDVKHWTQDEKGRTFGGSDLYLKPMDMMQIGLLVLNHGLMNGKQVVSTSWLEAMTSEKVVLNEWDVMPNANGYGYYWWRRKINGHQAFIASGYGGQLIVVVPEVNLVMVATCFVDHRNRGRSEILRLHGFLDQLELACP